VGLNVGKAVLAMKGMTVGQLRKKYAEVFGEETQSRHKDYLLRRIVWRLQADAEGNLSERARLGLQGFGTTSYRNLAADLILTILPVLRFLPSHPP